MPLVGLPDETFPGTLFSLNGVTRNPGWGAQLDGEARFDLDTLAWSAAFVGQNDHVGWEEEGRDVESDPTRVLRDGLSRPNVVHAEQGPLVGQARPLGRDRAARPRDGADEFRRSDFAADLTVAFGPLSLFVEGLWRSSGQPCAFGAPCRYGYDDSRAALAGLKAEFPSVTYRYTLSRFHYLGAEAVEEIHMPGRSGPREGRLGLDRVQCEAPSDARRSQHRQGVPAGPGGFFLSARVNRTAISGVQRRLRAE